MDKNDNKALIWNLLQNHGHFNKIDPVKFDEIKEEFEIVVHHIAQGNKGGSILDLNKQVIATFIKRLEKYCLGNPARIKKYFLL